MTVTDSTSPASEPSNQDLIGTQPMAQRQSMWTRILLSLVIFVSGAVVGTCATLILIRQQVQYRIHHPEEMPAKIAFRIGSRLGLSDEQTEQVENLIVERQQAIQQIRREFQPQLETELEQLSTQIAALLDDDQRTQWQAWFQSLREQWLPTPPE